MKHGRPGYDRIQDPAGLIPDDEPVFLIRGQDAIGAAVVEFWAGLNEGQGGDPTLTAQARKHAFKMLEWRPHKLSDGLPEE